MTNKTIGSLETNHDHIKRRPLNFNENLCETRVLLLRHVNADTDIRVRQHWQNQTMVLQGIGGWQNAGHTHTHTQLTHTITHNHTQSHTLTYTHTQTLSHTHILTY